MDQLPVVVGRKDLLQKLIQILSEAWNHHGNVVFIEGVAGMGKTMLLKMLQQEVKRFPELEKATFAEGSCYESTGAQSAYQPFIEIFEYLAKPDIKRKHIAKLPLNLLKETAPDWLQVVPVVGAALSAGIKTVNVAGDWLIDMQKESLANQSQSLINQYINTLTSVASKQPLLVLIIEDAHWIDDASCQLLLRLSARIAHQRMVVLITDRSDYLDAQHALKKVQGEMLIKNQTQILSMTGLSKSQIRDYLNKRFNSVLHPRLAAWLEHLCSGNPLFITQYVSLLEQDQIIRQEMGKYIFDGELQYTLDRWQISGALARERIPEKLEIVLEMRINRLLEEDREMLQLGAVQGDTFMSLLLSELLARKETDVLSRLRQVIAKHRIINIYTGEEWLKKRSEFYIFEHHLMQQAFYNKLSPREKILYHGQIAGFLEHLLKEQNGPVRQLQLEVAYHYSSGNEPFLASQYYYLAAQSSFLSGAFVETIDLCQIAIEHIKQSGKRERILVEVIQLLLQASELRWGGKAAHQRDLQVVTLAEEADILSRQLGDLTLLARLQYLRALLAQATENLERCIELFKEALLTAQQIGDKIAEFMILSELGHSIVGQDIDEGLRLMYRAQDLYTHILQTISQTTEMERYYYRVQGLIGVGEFDRGHYGAALNLLGTSVAGLKSLGMKNELPRFGNFLGQLNIATGQYEEAEHVLKEITEVHGDDIEPHPWNGYNLGLLGKLYIEWGRIHDAIEPLTLGWQETQAIWNYSLVCLVRNFYAELLMHPNNKARDMITAKQLLHMTLEESKATGFERSTIVALSLLGRLTRYQGQLESALAYSTQAVEYLKRTGIRSALRVEEILFDHYLILETAGHAQEADNYLKEAYMIVQQKAESIQASYRQQIFLERVPVNKAIIAAFLQRSQTTNKDVVESLGENARKNVDDK